MKVKKAKILKSREAFLIALPKWTKRLLHQVVAIKNGFPTKLERKWLSSMIDNKKRQLCIPPRGSLSVWLPGWPEPARTHPEMSRGIPLKKE
jgi:hypothetical protein